MTPSWLLDLLAAIMLAIAAASVARVVARPLLAGRPWRPVRAASDVDLANALMGIAMAGMLVSRLTTLPSVAWEVLFGLLTAWFACRAWADARSVRGMAADRCTLHVLHCAAMLYMFLALGLPASGGAGMAGMPGMAGMGGPAAMATVSYPTLAGVFVALLLGYGVWDLNQLSGKRYSLGGAGVAADGPAAGAVMPGFAQPGSTVRAFLLAPGTRVGWDVVLGIVMAFVLVIMI